MTMSELQKAVVAQTDWPRTAEAATADAMILHAARIGVALVVDHDRAFDAWKVTERGTEEYDATLRTYLGATSHMLAQAQVAIALARAQKLDEAHADTLARDLYTATEDGGVVSELMWEYLSDRGVNPETVWAAAKEESA